MSGQSSIEWTNATWNPVTGCSKVSPGCAHCYAEAYTSRMAGQRGWIEQHRPWTPANAEHNIRLHPARLDAPLRWRKPRLVFVNSMSDLFHELVPDEFIATVFGRMAAAHWHTFQVLTKRPERMVELLNHPEFENIMRRASGELGHELPLPNVWLGVSIENRHYVHRADLLRDTPAAVRFISAEPLLGPLVPKIAGTEENPIAWWPDGRDTPCVPYDGIELLDIDWLIVGGESGDGHRPIKAEWVRDLQETCEVLDVAFFLKQWGGPTPKSGGRELDGRTWDEMPQLAATR